MFYNDCSEFMNLSQQNGKKIKTKVYKKTADNDNRRSSYF